MIRPLPPLAPLLLVSTLLAPPAAAQPNQGGQGAPPPRPAAQPTQPQAAKPAQPQPTRPSQPGAAAAQTRSQGAAGPARPPAAVSPPAQPRAAAPPARPNAPAAASPPRAGQASNAAAPPQPGAQQQRRRRAGTAAAGAAGAAAAGAAATAAVVRPPEPEPPPQPAAPPKPAVGTATGLPLPRFAALGSNQVNMRIGPDLRYRIEWTYQRRDLPVQIIEEHQIWRKIRDPEGTEGWVQRPLLNARRTFLVQGDEERALRRRPEADAPVVARLKPGVIGLLRRCEAASPWCEVRVADHSGWIRRSEIWGVAADEAIE